MPDAWTDPSLAFTPSPTPVGFIRTVYEDSWSVATFEVEITAADIVAATARRAADGADGAFAPADGLECRRVPLGRRFAILREELTAASTAM